MHNMMEVMEIPEVAAAVGGVAEILVSLLGDRNFELASSVAPAVVSGVVVGGCTLVGGLLGGRMGLLIGKCSKITVCNVTICA